MMIQRTASAPIAWSHFPIELREVIISTAVSSGLRVRRGFAIFDRVATDLKTFQLS